MWINILWVHLLRAIPKLLKNHISDANIHNLVFHDHYLIRKQYMYFQNRLNSKQI